MPFPPIPVSPLPPSKSRMGKPLAENPPPHTSQGTPASPQGAPAARRPPLAQYWGTPPPPPPPPGCHTRSSTP